MRLGEKDENCVQQRPWHLGNLMNMQHNSANNTTECVTDRGAEDKQLLLKSKIQTNVQKGGHAFFVQTQKTQLHNSDIIRTSGQTFLFLVAATS